jgi:hypothetical protein
VGPTTPRIPEPDRKPGVCYAWCDSGLELPVIDVTHPAFRREVDDAELFARAEAFARAQAAKGPVARRVQRLMLRFFLRRSRLGRGILRASDGYLDGVTTYLMKLGPRNLGSGYATPADRKLAEGMERAGLSVGLRLQDVAEMLAAGLRPVLAADAGRPLHFVDVAGGPSMDALNALILLRKADAALLAGRRVHIDVLDLETEGPRFAAAALAALQADGAPLHGLRATLRHVPYDWNDVGPLEALLHAIPADAVVAASSEGGLFDYGADAAIAAYLAVLQAVTPPDAVVAATLSRPDDRRDAVAAVIRRRLEDLERLATPAGWAVAAHRGRPLNHVVLLSKR